MPLQISSTAFTAGEAIPRKFACDGPDVSPQLKWNDPPANTQAFALIIWKAAASTQPMRVRAA